MNVDDVFLILHHHWALDTSIFPDERQRLQLAFLLRLSAYTATLPAALVYNAKNRRRQREHYIGWEDYDSDNDENEMWNNVCLSISHEAGRIRHSLLEVGAE